MTYSDEQIRPVAEKLRIIYDGLGHKNLTDDEIWFLAIEHLEIKDRISILANKEVDSA